MAGELSAVRSHRAVIVSVVVAAVAVTLCALVAIAYMLGWVPSKAGAAKPAGVASPAQPAAASAPGVALLPGETLVAAPEAPQQAASPPQVDPPAAAPKKPGPVTPTFSQPAPTTPIYGQSAKKTTAAPIPIAPTGAQPSTPSVTKTLPSRAAPSAPSYRRDDAVGPAPRSYERSIRSLCVNCGTISSIRSFGNDWEVRVRFEDGTSETIRYPERPRLKVGERVTLEDGRLVPD